MWDEKRLDRFGELENRLTVSVSGDARPPQHLGSFALKDGKGTIVDFEVWNIDEQVEK